MSLPIPNPFGTESTQKVVSSWINNLTANSYVAPWGLLFFDTYDGVLRLGDNVTPGGQILDFGSATANGHPALPPLSIQFNAGPDTANRLANDFGGNVNFTYDPVANIVALTGNMDVTGYVTATANVTASTVIDTVGIFLDSDTVTVPIYSIPAGYNGLTGGPITITNGGLVDVPAGQRWTIV